MDEAFLSIVVPVFNEQEAISSFLDSCLPALEALRPDRLGGGDYEVLFIDDGSTDGTARAVLAAARTEPRIKLVRFSRNFGKEAALAAGFRYAAGDAVVPMDVDLQDPPDVLAPMVDAWREGGEIVNAVRRRRDGDPLFKRVTARLFYSLYNRVADVPIRANAGDFRLLDRAAVDALNQLPEGSRFTKALYAWIGYAQVDVEYDRPARVTDRTKWGLRDLWRFALDGMVGSTTAPLRVWSLVGIVIAIAAFAYAGYIIGKTLVFGIEVPGYASTLAFVLFLGGLNLISLGILGEYVGRMAQQLRDRPLFIVRTTHGLRPAERAPLARPQPTARVARSD